MPAPLRVVFAGTPEFAVPHLHACVRDNVNIVAVYTQPDRPSGRGRQLTQSPVKQSALALGLRVEQPQSLRDSVVQQQLQGLDVHLLAVVAYGLIVPRKVLAIPRHGCWNVHASLLPRWRGAAPIQRALLAGDAHTGVCLMQMEAGLDTGPVLLRAQVSIDAHDTSASLHDTLAELGARTLGEGLNRLLCNENIPGQVQSEIGVTYASKLDKAEAQLDWNEPAAILERKVRAYDPWPVAQADIAGESVRLWSTQAIDSVAQTPGTVVRAVREGIDIACGAGALRVLELQRAGGKRIRAQDYLNARPELKRA